MMRVARSLTITGVVLLAVVSCVGNSVDDTPNATYVTGLSLAPPTFGVQYRIPKFQVPPGADKVDCYYFKNPATVDYVVNKFEVKATKGTHHTTLFAGNEDAPDGVKACANFNGATALNPDAFTPMLGLDRISTMENNIWELPPGVGMKLQARRQMAMQVHYVNASTEKTPGNAAEVYLNMHGVRDTSTIKSYLGVIVSANNTLNIPARAEATFDATCQNPLQEELNIIAMTGHFHSRGRVFQVWVSEDGVNWPAQPVYYNDNWEEPPFKRFDPPLKVKPGGAYKYSCSYQNPSSFPIVEGPTVEENEHCRLQVYGYPFNPDKAGTTCFKER